MKTGSKQKRRIRKTVLSRLLRSGIFFVTAKANPVSGIELSDKKDIKRSLA